MTTVAHQSGPSLETVLSSENATLNDALAALANEVATPADAPAGPTPVAKSVVLSAEEKKALRTIASQVGGFGFPETPRPLTEDERRAAIEAYVNLKTAAAALKTAEEAFKSAFHNHIDAGLSQAEKDVAGIDAHAHYIIAGEVTAAGLAKKIVRGEVGGNPTVPTYEDLQKLEDDGVLTHEDVLGMTTALYVPAVRTRQADTAKIMAALRRDQPRIAPALAKAIRLTGKSTAIRVAKA